MSQNTVNDVRTWRDSKMPEWARDSVRQELIQAALSWPLEPKPKPLPFGFGSHDSMVGSVQPGVYWQNSIGFVSKFAVRLRVKGDMGFSRLVFNRNPDNPLSKWSNDVVRGPWFRTEKDACLFVLWEKCEDASRLLFSLKETVRTASDEVSEQL